MSSPLAVQSCIERIEHALMETVHIPTLYDLCIISLAKQLRYIDGGITPLTSSVSEPSVSTCNLFHGQCGLRLNEIISSEEAACILAVAASPLRLVRSKRPTNTTVSSDCSPSKVSTMMAIYPIEKLNPSMNTPNRSYTGDFSCRSKRNGTGDTALSPLVWAAFMSSFHRPSSALRLSGIDVTARGQFQFISLDLLVNVTQADLSNTRLTDRCIATLGCQPGLNSLNVSNNLLTHKSFAMLLCQDSFPKLTALDVSFNPKIGGTAALSLLQYLPDVLSRLRLTGCDFNPLIVIAIIVTGESGLVPRQMFTEFEAIRGTSSSTFKSDEKNHHDEEILSWLEARINRWIRNRLPSLDPWPSTPNDRDLLRSAPALEFEVVDMSTLNHRSVSIRSNFIESLRLALEIKSFQHIRFNVNLSTCRSNRIQLTDLAFLAGEKLYNGLGSQLYEVPLSKGDSIFSTSEQERTPRTTKATSLSCNVDAFEMASPSAPQFQLLLCGFDFVQAVKETIINMCCPNSRNLPQWIEPPKSTVIRKSIPQLSRHFSAVAPCRKMVLTRMDSCHHRKRFMEASSSEENSGDDDTEYQPLEGAADDVADRSLPRPLVARAISPAFDNSVPNDECVETSTQLNDFAFQMSDDDTIQVDIEGNDEVEKFNSDNGMHHENGTFSLYTTSDCMMSQSPVKFDALHSDLENSVHVSESKKRKSFIWGPQSISSTHRHHKCSSKRNLVHRIDEQNHKKIRKRLKFNNPCRSTDILINGKTSTPWSERAMRKTLKLAKNAVAILSGTIDLETTNYRTIPSIRKALAELRQKADIRLRLIENDNNKNDFNSDI